jgi:hypothetical protein
MALLFNIHHFAHDNMHNGSFRSFQVHKAQDRHPWRCR